MDALSYLENKMSGISAFFNRVSGMGGDGDHNGAEFKPRPRLEPRRIEAMLRAEPFIRTACEIIPEDIVRAWRIFPKLSGSVTAYDQIEKRLDFKKSVKRALYWSEAFGGALIVPRYERDEVPLSRMKSEYSAPEQGSLLGWRVYMPGQLCAYDGRTGKEIKYQSSNDLPVIFGIKNDSGDDIPIHESWTIPVFGLMSSNLTTKSHSDLRYAFGDSRVDLIYEHAARAIAGLNHTGQLLAKANIDLLKVSGFAAALKGCKNEAEINRAIRKVLVRANQGMQMAGIYQPMILDLTEEIERKGLSSGAAASVSMSEQLMSAYVSATRIPETKLRGKQSKGLNNGGESDLKNYYDYADGIREERVPRILEKMDKFVADDTGQDAPEWEFGDLTQIGAKDKSEIEKNRAARDKVYIDADIPGITSKVADRLDKDGTYEFTAEELAEIKLTEGPPDDEGE